LGNPFLLVFVTAVHALTALLPVAVLLAWSSVPAPMPALAASCLAMAFVQRVIIHRRVRLPAWVVALHPVAIVVMTAIQWHSFVLHLTGRRTWRGRAA
jgi:hypothetical protein